MRIVIDVTSPVHHKVQIANQLREGIASGEYTDLLPSLTQIAEEAGVAIGTVSRAIEILKDEGLVYGVPGRGTFVRKEETGG